MPLTTRKIDKMQKIRKCETNTEKNIHHKCKTCKKYKSAHLKKCKIQKYKQYGKSQKAKRKLK